MLKYMEYAEGYLFLDSMLERFSEYFIVTWSPLDDEMDVRFSQVGWLNGETDDDFYYYSSHADSLSKAMAMQQDLDGDVLEVDCDKMDQVLTELAKREGKIMILAKVKDGVVVYARVLYEVGDRFRMTPKYDGFNHVLDALSGV